MIKYQMEEDIRWKQRFANFESSYLSLKEVLEQNDLDEQVMVDAAIKRFELTFELAWKTLQDYLLAQGYAGYTGPRKVIGKAFQDKLIDDGPLWFVMLEDRNVLVHAYDYDKSRLIYEEVERTYIYALEKLYNKLKNE